MQGSYADYCTLIFTNQPPHSTTPKQAVKCVLNNKNGFLEMEEDVPSPDNKGGARIRSLSDSHVPLMGDGSKLNGCASIQSIKGGDGTKITKYQWYHAKKEQCYDPKKDESMKTDSAVSASLSEDWQSAADREMLLQMAERALDKACSASSWYTQTYEQQGQLPSGQQGEPLSRTLELLQKLTDEHADKQLKREELETHELTPQLYPYIPLDDDGNVTSLGSILHAQGICKPCGFWKKDRCHKKDLCLHCHLEHDIPESRSSRKSKSKRMRLRSKEEKSDAALRFSL